MPNTQDQLPEFRKGKKLLASDLNELTRQIKRTQVTSSQGVIRNGVGTFIKNPKHITQRDPDYVKVRNDTGADLTHDHPVVGLDTAVNPPTDTDSTQSFRMPCFSGVTPTEDHTGKFAILCGPVKDGEWQWGVVSGTSWVRLKVNSEDDDSADVESGESGRLESGEGVATILWLGPSESGSPDVRWANVRIGGGGGGSGPQIITFSILGFHTDEYGNVVDCACVDANPTGVSCNSEDVEDEIIQVYDHLGCMFNVPEEMLVGKSGFAVRMKGAPPDNVNTDPYASEEDCHWCVIQLCCPEE